MGKGPDRRYFGQNVDQGSVSFCASGVFAPPASLSCLPPLRATEAL